MKVETLLISWNEQQAICSLDLSPVLSESKEQIVATAGADTNIRLWSLNSSNQVNYLCSLSAHGKCVNVVRFSGLVILGQDGQEGCLLASAGDGILFFFNKCA